MPFRLSLLFAVRSDQLMQQVNKHCVGWRLPLEATVHCTFTNLYPFSLTLSFFIVRVTFLLLSFDVCLSSRVLGKVNSPFARPKHRWIGVTSCILVKCYRRFGRSAAFIFWLEDEGSTFLRHSHVSTRLHAVLSYKIFCVMFPYVEHLKSHDTKMEVE